MFRELFEECVEIVDIWKPKKEYPKEELYRDDLIDFLFDKLNEEEHVKVVKEAGRGLCDIAVGNKRVGIELKRNLKNKSEMNRLQGQVDDYEDEYEEGIIIVLVGEIDKFG